MKVTVKVKPNAKSDKLVELSQTEFSASVKAPPQDGKANSALIELLSNHFKVPRKQISLLRGASSRNKLFEIL
ncbi:MAG: DUF167 domain-containing protein [Nitrospirae bacterium]|nr:DUF167 domain-containing protein [Nitrospirota bacterium]MBI3594803.1 DUF167 domain-containing protein [Nitrospirota bacterium]